MDLAHYTAHAMPRIHVVFIGFFRVGEVRVLGWLWVRLSGVAFRWLSLLNSVRECVRCPFINIHQPWLTLLWCLSVVMMVMVIVM